MATRTNTNTTTQQPVPTEGKLTYEEALQEIENSSIVKDLAVIAKAVTSLSKVGVVSTYKGIRNWDWA